ncbi:quinone oxidoreductase [Fusarium torreyae]|uniref:Dehydrogenase FUB6 n=1 Tax=Fusarium torreyae TaxID=1237075 RepID=A0A9W8RNJ2_9HYPO|nr:quinone oxidoreductase [Fusarium torreyae]
MVSRPTQCRAWVLKNKPTGIPILSGDETTFALTTIELPPLKENQVLVKALYFSNDPAQRGWIDPIIPKERLYVTPAEVGQPMRARALGQIIESTSNEIEQGAIVRATINWQEYAVLDANSVYVTAALPHNLSLTHYLGALGSTGLTAYYGLLDVGEARKGDKVVVSGAAGATGSMVVQIAKKIVGAESVIGIAGTDEKCRWVEELGADKCKSSLSLNYKSPTFKQDLHEATSAGVDLYFDNVGGEILDLMLTRMSRHGRITACGAISGYNSDNPCVLHNYFHVISMRVRIQGMIIHDFPPDKASEAQDLLLRAIADGQLSLSDDNETVVPTAFEKVPETWLKLFQGSNTGKLVTQLMWPE